MMMMMVVVTPEKMNNKRKFLHRQRSVAWPLSLFEPTRV